MARYAELHCHTNFSFLDGASPPGDLVRRAAELGYTALAITDHHGFYGAPRFRQAAEEAGLPTVYGVEVGLSRSLPPPRRRGRAGGGGFLNDREAGEARAGGPPGGGGGGGPRRGGGKGPGCSPGLRPGEARRASPPWAQSSHARAQAAEPAAQ